jgi:hypothetical protein
MVSVAQLVERQTVDLDVAGSNPVAHPNPFSNLSDLTRAMTTIGLRRGCGFLGSGLRDFAVQPVHVADVGAGDHVPVSVHRDLYTCTLDLNVANVGRQSCEVGCGGPPALCSTECSTSKHRFR